MSQRYISVILPLALEWEPVYRGDESLRIGDRVSVWFSGRKYIGAVSGEVSTPDVDPGKIRDAIRPQERYEPVSEREIAYWRHLASYYLCTVGEVYKAAYPYGRLRGEEIESRSEDRLRQRLERTREKLAVARKDSTRERYQEDILRIEAALSGKAYAASAPTIEATTLSKILNPEETRPVLCSGLAPSLVPGEIAPLVAETLTAGRSVLYLVPEIEAGASVGEDLSMRFPGLILYHSRLSESQRRSAGFRAREEEPVFVLGTRSALFLPFRDLGLIIVSEEQSPSFKQDSPAPRYNARDAAILLAKVHGSRLLITALTPSLESVYNASAGRYAACPFSGGAVTRCRTILIDTGAEWRKGGMKGNFSIKLLEAILGCPGKVLIVESYLRDELLGLIPEASEKLVFGAREGMYGPDFKGVSLVASVQTDRYFSRGNFRADERADQLLRQFSSYCSKEGSEGTFIIQTRQPRHPVLKQLAEGGDVTASLLVERQACGYPPYSRITDVVLRDVNTARLHALAGPLAGILRDAFPGISILGPEALPGDEITSVIRILLPRDRDLKPRKEQIRRIVDTYKKDRHYAGHIHLDVDPL